MGVGHEEEIGGESIEITSDQAASSWAGSRAVLTRVLAVDTVRGLTIFLMVFVNDLGRGAPSWMHHIRPPRADGMTLADVVFPFFLFIVGVSVPLALERAEVEGVSRRRQIGHILTRTAALLLLGVIEMNAGADRTLRSGLWETLAFLAVLAAWCQVPAEKSVRRGVLVVLKAAGILSLTALLAVYRREPRPAEVPFYGTVSDWAWLRIGWWGILGLIGWAYLSAGLLTLWLGRRREWLMGALGTFILLHIAVRNGGLFARLDTKPWLGAAQPALHSLSRMVQTIGGYIGLGDAVGSLSAVAMAGCLLGSILRRDSDVMGHRDRLGWASTFTIGLFLAGLITDTFEGINKIAATPTWCLWSAALACLLWMVLYLILDVAGRTAWSVVFRPAGANPLLAYFLHPIVIGLISLSGFWNTLVAYKNSHEPWVVVAGSLAMALLICTGTGLFARLGLRLRL